jgi:hypothetical protein
MNNAIRALFASFLVMASLGFRTENVAFAQSANDSWTQLAEKMGTFSPHANNCSSTEVYVSIGGGTAGFCMEKDQRTATTWGSAKETCAAAGGRLPEPAEFQWACYNPPAGLIHMTNDWEWASNHSTLFLTPSSGYELTAPIMGNAGCNNSWGAWISDGSGHIGSVAYRCVH